MAGTQLGRRIQAELHSQLPLGRAPHGGTASISAADGSFLGRAGPWTTVFGLVAVKSWDIFLSSQVLVCFLTTCFPDILLPPSQLELRTSPRESFTKISFHSPGPAAIMQVNAVSQLLSIFPLVSGLTLLISHQIWGKVTDVLGTVNNPGFSRPAQSSTF